MNRKNENKSNLNTINFEFINALFKDEKNKPYVKYKERLISILFMLLALLTLSEHYYIPKTGDVLSSKIYLMWVLAVSLVWFVVDPFKKLRTSMLNRTLIAFLPVGLLIQNLTLQYYYTLSVSLFILSLLIPFLFFVLLVSVNKNKATLLTVFKKCKKKANKFALYFISLMLTIVTIFFFIGTSITSTVTTSTVEPKIYVQDKNLLEKNSGILQKLQVNTWNTLNDQQKIDLLQQVANIEATYLGSEPVSVSTDVLSTNLTGKYDDNLKKIIINLKSLNNESPIDICETLLHELRHSYQHYMVSICSSLPVKEQDSSYFIQIKNWQENFNNYIISDGTKEGNTKYITQPVELDANNYAEERISDYAKVIDDVVVANVE